MEELLTEDEIILIIDESKNDRYSDSSRIYPVGLKTSIFKVSRKSGLILVHGNEDTGYNHIFNRHSQWSRMPYWKEGEIGNPTKFKLSVAPIDYLTVADAIFLHHDVARKNVNNQFDVYEGKFRHRDNEEIPYRLLTYKDTKIVHTLYPKQAPSNKSKKPKLKNLRQGFAGNCSEDMRSGIQYFEYSYYNQKDVEIFKVILRSILAERKEKWYIQVNDTEGNGIVTTIIKTEPLTQRIELPFRVSPFTFSNVSWIEVEIAKIIRGDFSF